MRGPDLVSEGSAKGVCQCAWRRGNAHDQNVVPLDLRTYASLSEKQKDASTTLPICQHYGKPLATADRNVHVPMHQPALDLQSVPRLHAGGPEHMRCQHGT